MLWLYGIQNSNANANTGIKFIWENKEILESNLPEHKREVQAIQLKLSEFQSVLTEAIIPKFPFNWKMRLQSLNIKVVVGNFERDASAFIMEDGSYELRFNRNLVLHKKFASTFAHELFHALHHLINPRELSWKREALAKYFEFLVFGVKPIFSYESEYVGTLPNFLRASYHGNQHQEYAHSFYFLKYVIDRCGGKEIFWSMANHFDWRTAFENTDGLAPKNSCFDFYTMLKDYQISFFHNRMQYSFKGQKGDEILSMNLRYLLSRELVIPKSIQFVKGTAWEQKIDFLKKQKILSLKLKIMSTDLPYFQSLNRPMVILNRWYPFTSIPLDNFDLSKLTPIDLNSKQDLFSEKYDVILF